MLVHNASATSSIGLRDLPAETRNYVFAITGHPVEEWKAPVVQGSSATNPGDRRTDGSAVNCRDVLAQLERASNSRSRGMAAAQCSKLVQRPATPRC